MKQWIAKVCLLAFVVSALFGGYQLSALGGRQAEAAVSEELRGMWIASVYNIDFPSKQNLSTVQMKQELDTILDDAQTMHLNAIFFQVRPTADALYQSSLFPWSVYLTGQQGKALAQNFDPLAYLIAEGKKRGIGIHAWINPYKITRGTAAKPNLDIKALSEENPARKYPDLVVAHSSGELYLNPGEPMSRYLVLQGVKELLDHYDIAGIHYDDYFYPTGSFADADTYKKYGAGYSSIEDWRRHNVDLLIQETHQLVQQKQGVVFGVSPAGVWANASTNGAGSNTSAGVQTYYDHYADTRKWVQQGWLDYIAPQIYWQIGHKQCDYATLVDWWSNVTRGTGVKLYIGHAAYKTGDSAQGTQWLDGQELARQIAYNRANGNVNGSIFYGYGALKSNTLGIKDSVTALFE
ncbi:MAG: glycoside hydrolase family 10 protein [Peptococcaceae bacterium]